MGLEFIRIIVVVPTLIVLNQMPCTLENPFDFVHLTRVLLIPFQAELLAVFLHFVVLDVSDPLVACLGLVVTVEAFEQRNVLFIFFFFSDLITRGPGTYVVHLFIDRGGGGL